VVDVSVVEVDRVKRWHLGHLIILSSGLQRSPPAAESQTNIAVMGADFHVTVSSSRCLMSTTSCWAAARAVGGVDGGLPACRATVTTAPRLRKPRRFGSAAIRPEYPPAISLIADGATTGHWTQQSGLRRVFISSRAPSPAARLLS
jgi:hypothetical protein